MAGIASFPHARELSSTAAQTAWDAALSYWAEETECEKIDTENTNEFFRVWLACIMYGTCLFTAVSVPYCLCTNRRDKSFEGAKQFDLKTCDSGDVQADQDCSDDATPNIAKAKAHLRDTSPLNAQGQWRGVWSTQMAEISEVGGLGIELYFRLLRTLGLCFAYLTIFSLPVLTFSFEGNFVPDIGTQFARMTVGNIGRIAPDPIPQAERLVIVACQGMPLVKMTKYFGWCDFCGAMLYFLFVAYYRFKYIPQAMIQDDCDNVTCRDFSLEVSGLPRRLKTMEEQEQYEEKLAMHITGLIKRARDTDKYLTSKADGKVCEVALVRNFEQRLNTLQKQAKLKKKQDIATAYGKTANLYKYGCCGKVPVSDVIDKNNEKLAQKLSPEPELDVLRAYVILNSPDDKIRLQRMYRFANFRLGRCCQTDWMRFEGKAIRMREPPEPTNILWPNQDVPFAKRISLKYTMLFIFFIVMVGSLLGNFIVQRVARDQGSGAAVQIIGDPACDAGTQVEGGLPCGIASVGKCICEAKTAMNWTLAFVNTSLAGNKEATDCWCGTVGTQAIASNSTLRDGICKPFLEEAAATAAMGAAASGIVVVINVVLKVLISAFVEKEKHVSVSSRDSSVMVKVAVTQTLNTAAIVFLLNYNGLGIFKGDYSDFERGWYAVVGSAVCLNMLLNSFMGAFTNFVSIIVAALKRCPCITKRKKHQAELLTVFENKDFDIATRYAQILTTCFCTLVYSPGLPVLNFFAVIYFFVNYWVDKLILLRCSKRPPSYDATMPKQATEMLMLAAPAHMVFSIAMYSHNCTFPSKALGGSLGSMADQAQSMNDISGEGSGSFGDRVARECTWMSFVALVLTCCALVMLLLKLIIGGTFGSIFRACKTICCPRRGSSLAVAPETSEEEGEAKDGEEAKEQQQVTWDAAWQFIEKTRPPASYRVERNRDMEPLMRFMREDFSQSLNLTPKSDKSGTLTSPETPGSGSDDAPPGASATIVEISPRGGPPSDPSSAVVEVPPKIGDS